MSERIRRISVSFTEDEFNRLKEVKIVTGLSWHDLLLEMLEVFIRSRRLGIHEIPPEKNEQLTQRLEELRSLEEKTKGGENE